MRHVRIQLHKQRKYYLDELPNKEISDKAYDGCAVGMLSHSYSHILSRAYMGLDERPVINASNDLINNSSFHPKLLVILTFLNL